MKTRLLQWLADYRDDAFLALGVALIAFTAFGLGRATAPRPAKTPLTVEKVPVAASVTDAAIHGGTPRTAGEYVASKNGTKYYLPSCSGVTRIKEENKIWFDTKEEAERRGYQPAANCEGL